MLFESLSDIAERADREIGGVEQALLASGQEWIIGTDEAGRGPLAGPVSVAAVLMPCSAGRRWIEAGLTDSKMLGAEKRAELEGQIRGELIHSVIDVSAGDVDALNVLQASLEGMRRAIASLCVPPGVGVLVDGNRPIKGLGREQATLTKGDRRSVAIAAASILAKEHRDRVMCDLAVRWPMYGFEQHKGYPTPAHLTSLQEHGPCEEHRRSFGPVKAFFQGGRLH